jgi:hypothetical protein
MPQTLVKVVSTQKPNGEVTYTGTFSDGVIGVIRCSCRKYVAVAQLAPYVHSVSQKSEYLFSSKPTPIIGISQQKRHLVTVQIQTQTKSR